MIRTYTELCKFTTLEDRFEYLRLNGHVGEELFGYQRYLNQVFYATKEWKRIRREVIIRDHGCDLGLEDWPIFGFVHVHHMNPITLEQIKNNDPILLDPEYLISSSRKTHEAITWGDPRLLPKPIIVRRPDDMCPWKQ